MSIWYVLLNGSQEDLAHVKRLFGASEFTLDRIDDKDALAAPAFQSGKDAWEVIDAGMKLLAAINTSLRISLFQYAGLQVHGVIEKRADGTIHRTMLAQGGDYRLEGAIAVAKAASFSEPVRNKEERLASLLAKNPAVEDVANRMATRPLSWAAMNTAYESVVGLMSSKSNPDDRRSDYEGLVARRWLTIEESERFYHTAAYHRKGYPKTPVRKVTPMEYQEACNLTTRLFWRLVDELEPT